MRIEGVGKCVLQYKTNMQGMHDGKIIDEYKKSRGVLPRLFWTRGYCASLPPVGRSTLIVASLPLPFIERTTKYPTPAMTTMAMIATNMVMEEEEESSDIKKGEEKK